MGNKLCAPWKKGYQDENHPWAPKKDSHLLRLWAEIFEVREEGGDICWARVSDDVVPVNITCIQDTPDTVFQITAYNRHVEKIFDVRLIQPGTRITQASECFVHWKDSRSEHEWGLNFTTPVDARRFRDCCMVAAGHNYARKASSSGSLRLSPPKRVRGRKATSNPASPVTQPRRAVSNPEEIGAGYDPGYSPNSTLDSQSGHSDTATQPRARNRQLQQHQQFFGEQHPFQGQGQKPGSNNSVYDNVGSLRRQQRHGQVMHKPPPHPNMHRPIGEREIPFSEYHSDSSQHRDEGIYATVGPPQSQDPHVWDHDTGCYGGPPPEHYQTYHAGMYSTSGYQTDPHLADQNEQVDHYHHGGMVQQQRLYRSQEMLLEQRVSEPTHDRPDPIRDNDSNVRQELQQSKQELRQFSREPTVIKLDKLNQLEANMMADSRADYDNYPINAPNVADAVDVHQIRHSVAEANRRESLRRQHSTGGIISPPVRRLGSTGSMDWPPPPDSAGCATPPTPQGLTQAFDSNTLRRLLRNLPDGTQSPNGGETDTAKLFEFDSNLEGRNNNGNRLIRQRSMPESPVRVRRSSSETRNVNRNANRDSGIRDNGMDFSPSPPSSETPQGQILRQGPSPVGNPPNNGNSQQQVPRRPLSATFHSQTQNENLKGTVQNQSGNGQNKSERIQNMSSNNHNGNSKDQNQTLGGGNGGGNHPNNNNNAVDSSAKNNRLTQNVQQNPTGKPPIKPQRIPLDQPASDHGVQYRSTQSHSYPDSGISMSATETTGSVKSGDSGRSRGSGRSSKSSTLPPGLGVSAIKSRSSGGSSGGSSRHSDPFRHSFCTGSGSETTELSDDSESESSSEAGTSDSSSIHTMPTESQANFASKSAAVRKAGWLTVKNWLVHKKRKIELASKRQWKKYWVCLKGTVLLFYPIEDNEQISEDSVPRHMLVIEGGIAQAVPEHPKREFIFALSTTFGDGYLFQAPSQIELENWITGIHSACASSFARQHGKENTLKLLRSEISKLENSIDLDIKMKKMANLQITVCTDPRSKTAIEKQISSWDENLEKLYIEQYRLRCYMASLQGSELPNPKTLLGCASKTTKHVLGRVGVFTVTSFHALVCSRTPLTSTTVYNTTGRNKKRGGLLSTFKADGQQKARPKSPKPFSPQSSDVPITYKNPDIKEHVVVDLGNHDEADCQVSAESIQSGDHQVRVLLPNCQSSVVAISEKMTVAEVLELSCNKRQLNPNDHFIRLKYPSSDDYKYPDKSSLIQSEEYEVIEVCAKILFQIELTREEKDKDFGMAVEAELAEDTEQEDELCVFISELSKGGLAQRKGLLVGDEILVINSKVIAELDMVYVENLLAESDSMTLTVRSCRTERPTSTTALMEHADIYIENMMCPPPPSQNRISDKVIGDLIVPAPNWVQSAGSDLSDSEVHDMRSPRLPRDISELSASQIDHLLKGAEQVTHFCRLLHQPTPGDPPVTPRGTDQSAPGKPLSESQRLQKVIRELIETERTYVKDLACLIERYLEPLKEETYLSGEDIEQLFGNIQEIVLFQKQFLQSLEDAVHLEPNFNLITDPKMFRDEDLRRVLFSVGGSFLYYANHFKLYSSFCASHSKAQKVLNPETNQQLAEFLKARNPKQQHSSTLESYLIKPIQRILKYPLLLRQLKDLTDPQSDEHHHLSEALRGMEAVAEHINEMQKIYEEYGNVFDDLIRLYKDSHRMQIDLNVGDLQMYGNVNWLNALDELGKIKKGTELVTMLFVFKTGVVILAQERIKGKKKQRPPPGKPISSVDLGEVIRFQAAIRVDQLQVRSVVNETSERHGLWELIHCRSEKEGRPETIFQFASSQDAKRDFIKTIHHTIRESVRRMSIPTPKSAVRSTPPSPGSNRTQSPHIPNGQGQARRPESLSSPGSGGGTPPHGGLGASQSVGKKKGRQLRADMMVRHSMDVEDKIILPGPISSEQSIGTRSRTLTDLNCMDLADTGRMPDSTGGYPSGSQSTIASEASRSSARLLHSSNSPNNYSTAEKPQKDGLGSPIWKPRNANQKKPGPVVRNQPSIEEKSEGALHGAAYGDYSNIVYDDKNSVRLQHPNAPYVEYEDTDC